MQKRKQRREKKQKRKNLQSQCAGDVATAAVIQQAVFDSLQFKQQENHFSDERKPEISNYHISAFPGTGR